MAGYGGFRVGVVVVAAGLALLGPHAVVAAADAGDSAARLGADGGSVGNPGQDAGSVGRRGSTPQRAAARTVHLFQSAGFQHSGLSPPLRAVIGDPVSTPLVPAGRAVAARRYSGPGRRPTRRGARWLRPVSPPRASSSRSPLRRWEARRGARWLRPLRSPPQASPGQPRLRRRAARRCRPRRALRSPPPCRPGPRRQPRL